MHKILVAYDFSEMANGALEFAAERARSSETLVKVIHVAAGVAAVERPGDAARPPSDAVIATIRDDIRSAVARCGLESTVDVIVSDRAALDIVKAADEFGADEIVMGTRGLGGLRRAVLGSVADHVTRNATCAVTTIRRGNSRAA